MSLTGIETIQDDTRGEGQDQDETPAGTIPETSRYTVIGVAEAARRLWVTQDAVRKRLQRGTLQGIKTGSTWDVVETDELQDATPTDAPGGQYTVSGRPENVPDATGNDLVAHLQGEVTSLRERLEEADRKRARTLAPMAEERERFDVIHRAALERIEALAATVEPQHVPRSDETRAPRQSPQPDDAPLERASTGFWERFRRWFTGESRESERD